MTERNAELGEGKDYQQGTGLWTKSKLSQESISSDPKIEESIRRRDQIMQISARDSQVRNVQQKRELDELGRKLQDMNTNPLPGTSPTI